MRLSFLCFCAIAPLLLTSPALAGAWTQDAGKGQAIITTDYYSTDYYYDNQGHRQNQPTYHKYELNPYLEYGLTDTLTAGANLSLQRADQQGNPSQTNWGLGDSEFFLRQRLWRQNGFVVSAEPMIKLPSPESPRIQPQLGGSHPDIGLGLLGGYGFSVFGRNHFADLDTQYRVRFGAPQDQIRLSGTIGIGLTERLMLMPQAFLTWRAHSPQIVSFTESPADDYNLVKLQLSAVYRATNDISFQAGGFTHLSGKNVGGGDGALLAIWKRF